MSIPLALIVLVDPTCETCVAAKDSLRERVEKSSITYYVMMLPAENNTQKYFAFTDSLNLDAESFVWSNAEVKPPETLATLPVPSYILLTTERLVVDKWSGIDKSAGIRQIASDAVAHLRRKPAGNQSPN